MTTEQLNNYLVNPAAMNADDLKVIEEYRKKHPYSPVFAALYAKVLHNLKDLNYDEALRDAAIVLPDRAVLYQLIYKEPLQEKIVAVQEELEESLPLVDKVDRQDGVEETVIDKPVVEVVEGEEEQPKVESEKKEEASELEQEILIEAINTSIQLDVDQLLDEEVPDSIEEWQETKADTTNKEGSKLEIQNSKSKAPSKFSDWLFAMKDTNEKSEVEKQEREKLLSSSDLIDRFIKTKPRKIDISKDPVTPQEMGKLSLVEDEGFVTETLAEIYAKQGKYHKAIKIYEQLSLNNPEKKVFFASRIRFLREKLEYDK